MSWDAWLTDDRGHEEGSWNYTHNTSRMIYDVLDDAGVELPASTRPCSCYEDGEWVKYPNGHGTVPWWTHLNGMTGAEGAGYLRTIVDGLTADPARFRAMNPANGWGDYDSLLVTLNKMLKASLVEWPTVWGTNG